MEENKLKLVTEKMVVWKDNKIKWYHVVILLTCLIVLFNLDFHFVLAKPSTTMLKPQEQTPTKKVKKKSKPRKESEFAAADPNELSELTTAQYIAKYKKYAIAEMKKHKIPASITLAQAILESRNGNSRLAKNINNHFGIKCHSRGCKKGHCAVYADDSPTDRFIRFKEASKSYQRHSEVVLNKRYTSRLRGRKDYKTWAWALQSGGYATGAKYGSKIIRVIEMYHLDDYDKI